MIILKNLEEKSARSRVFPTKELIGMYLKNLHDTFNFLSFKYPKVFELFENSFIEKRFNSKPNYMVRFRTDKK